MLLLPFVVSCDGDVNFYFKVVSELNLILPKATAVAIDVANKVMIIFIHNFTSLFFNFFLAGLVMYRAALPATCIVKKMETVIIPNICSHMHSNCTNLIFLILHLFA